jgi:alkylation response protein AidB-like acyl-CoA dehydrogenase
MEQVEAAAWSVATEARARAAERDETGAFPDTEFQALHTQGLLAAPLPRKLGGLGLGSEPCAMPMLLRVLAILGWGTLSLARLYEGHVNALLLITTFGSTEQRELAAAAARRGEVFAVWNTEAGDGVRLERRGAGTHELRGAKSFASGAGSVTRPLVTGRLPDGGWQMMILHLGEADHDRVDTSWWRPLGMVASASHRIDFRDMEIGPEAFLGAPGDYYRQPWFSGGAIRFAAAQLGGAAALLDAAVATLREAGRTEDALQQARLGEATMAIASGEQWLDWAADRADASLLGGSLEPEVGAEDMVAAANMTRTAIEHICLQVLGLVERSVGARGLLRPHPIERIGRDLTLYLRQPAPDAALRDAGRFALHHETPALTWWHRGSTP